MIKHGCQCYHAQRVSWVSWGMNENDFALWQQVLTQDDPRLVRQAAEHLPAQDQATRLAEALATTPLPGKALGVLDELGWFKKGWIFTAANTSLPHDWTAIFAWRRGHAGNSRTDEEIKDAVEDGFRLFARPCLANPNVATNLERMLIATLAQPGVVELCRDFLASLHPTVLFDLASKERGQACLAQSGLDVDKIIRAGFENRNYMERMNPGRDWTEGEMPRTPLDRWLDLDPAYRQAWDACVDQDWRMAREFGPWLQCWMPGPWHTSPLNTWCQKMLAGQPWEGPSPLEAPFLEKCAPNIGAREFAERLDQVLASTTRYTPDCDVLLDTIHAIRNQVEPGYGRHKRIAPTSPTALWAGLSGSHPWIDDFARSEPGARYIQQAMTQDFRITQAFGEWTGRRVADTVLEQPAWQSWRDEHGRNLLQVHLDLDVRMDKRPGERILVKLARQAPQLFTEPDDQGRKVLDTLPMLASTRKKLERVLLVKNIVPVRRKRESSRPRM